MTMNDFNYNENEDSFISFTENISDITKQIPKSTSSLKNRIQSIIQDSKFVKKVSESYGMPLIGKKSLIHINI